MRFKSIRIKDFQGCNGLEFDFSPSITSIIGANGTGKTTILDAIKWCLFGKDFEDKARFDIRKIDEAGAESYNPVMVRLVIEHDGVEHTLDRALIASGTTCYVDGVPCKASEYSAFVAKLTDGEERFKLYTDPLYFFSLGWKDQRSLLMRFFPEPPSEFILAGREFTNAFKQKLMGMTPEKIIEYSNAEVKRLDKEIAVLSGKAEAYSEQLGFSADDIKQANDKIPKIEEALAEANAVLDLANAKRIEQLERRVRISDLKSKIGLLEFEAKTELLRMQDGIKRRIGENDQKLASLKEEASKIAKTPNECPACHRPYSADDVEKYNADREAAMECIRNEAEKLKSLISTDKAILEAAEGAMVVNPKLEELQKELKEAENSPVPYIPDTEKAERDLLELNKQKTKYEHILTMAKEVANRTSKLKEVEKGTQELYREREAKEGLGKEAEKYISLRTKLTVDQLNAKFKTIRVKLFDTQANGNVKETFEITRKGVPFSALNTASQLEVGIELSEFLKDGMGVECPVLIDNGERYTDVDFGVIRSQVIIATAMRDTPLTIM